MPVPGMFVARPQRVGDGEFTVNRAERVFPSNRRFLRRIEVPAPYRGAAMVDASAPFPAPSVDADKAGCVVALHPLVAAVAALVRKTQVLNAIVVAYAIAMVDLIRSPFSVDVQPSENVRAVMGTAVFNANRHIPKAGNGSSNPSRISRIPTQVPIWTNAPAEDACARVVLENRSDKLRAEWRAWLGLHLSAFLGINKAGIALLPLVGNQFLAIGG